MGLVQLVDAFDLRQLQFVVDAGRQMAFAHRHTMDSHAIGHGQGNHIGQIVFALGIAVLQSRQPLFQMAVGQNQNACVDFTDGFLLSGSVFFFHNGANALLIANDAA